MIMLENKLYECASQSIKAGAAQIMAAFDRVVIVDRDGAVLAASGIREPGSNLFDDPEFLIIARQVAACFDGQGFVEPTVDSSEVAGLWRVHGIPIADEPGTIGAVALVLEDLHDDYIQFKRLKSQVDELDFVVRNIRQGIWRLDVDGRILFVNPFLAAWLESTPQRMVGEPAALFKMDRSASPDAQGSGVSQRYEARFETVNGLTRHGIVVSSTVHDLQGSPTSTIEIVTDVSAEFVTQTRLLTEVQRMATLAGSDVLTGLPNRRAFESEFAASLKSVENQPFGMILLDFDGLKEINDRFGHGGGDQALKSFAARLLAEVRNQDKVARVGGDEFAILVHSRSAEELRDVHRRLSERMTFTEMIDGEAVTLHASSGFAHANQDPNGILRRADEALYADKRRHRPNADGPEMI